METKQRMMKDAASAKGFTLIELMIVIAIIGILAAVAIPNFLRARDKGRFSACVETLAGLKTAIEMVAADNPGTNGPYENAKSICSGADYCICVEMMQTTPCTLALIETRVGASCTAQGGGGGAWTTATGIDIGTPTTYKIMGTAKDKKKCQITIDPDKIDPASYTLCP